MSCVKQESDLCVLAYVSGQITFESLLYNSRFSLSHQQDMDVKDQFKKSKLEFRFVTRGCSVQDIQIKTKCS